MLCQGWQLPRRPPALCEEGKTRHLRFVSDPRTKIKYKEKYANMHSSRKRASENYASLNDWISDCKWSERTKRENTFEKSADSQGGKGGWTWAKRIAILVTQLIRYVKYRSKNRNKTETPYAASRGARAQGCPLIVAHRLVNPDFQNTILRKTRLWTPPQLLIQPKTKQNKFC